MQVGDSANDCKTAHVIVTTPGWIVGKLKERKALDMKNVKALIFDEADEIYTQ